MTTNEQAAAETVDVIVIGLGPGGEEVGSRLAAGGLSVVGIDSMLVGGECPNWGCIPSKMIIRAADLLAESRRVEGMSGTAVTTADWGPVHARVRDEATDDWNDQVAVDRFVGHGAQFVRGTATLDGPGRVKVGDRTFVATRGIVISTGASAWTPPVPGLADTPFWTNRETIATDTAPASLAVLGGGAIGIELAQAFSRFGTLVTVLEVGPSVVGPEEPEAAALLTRVLEGEGVTIHTGVKVESVAHDDGGFTVNLEGQDPVVAEKLLVAAGRRVVLDALGVDTIGLDPTARALPVDDHLRVEGAANVWAVGDVAGRGAFTHMAMYQADIVVKQLLGQDFEPAEYRAVPRVTFTDPEIGSVGMTQRQAEAEGRKIRVGMVDVATTSRGWLHKAGNEGLIKVVEDANEGVLIGATSMGPWGGEVLGFLTLAIQARVPTKDLEHMIYPFPTFHRGIQAAIQDLHEV